MQFLCSGLVLCLVALLLGKGAESGGGGGGGGGGGLESHKKFSKCGGDVISPRVQPGPSHYLHREKNAWQAVQYVRFPSGPPPEY